MFKRLDLTGARILVTGASSGIGADLARALAAAQARLVLAARSAAALDELAAELRAAGADVAAVPTDVTDPDQRRRLLAETLRAFGGLDILVNNAGVGASGPFEDASEDRLRRVFEVNFFGAVELTRLALPHLARGRDPMIVNVSSVIGRRAVPGYVEYCASKFALSGWTEALRAELVLQGVHVLLVSPGLIDTPFRTHQVEDRLPAKWQGRRMSAARCARLIIKAMRRRRTEVVITWSGKLLVWLNRWFPAFADWLMARYSRAIEREQAAKP
jgi:short-subunit dehydrogenase